MTAINTHTGAADLERTRSAKTAAIVQPLVTFDGPQLLLLSSNRNLPMLAVAINGQAGEYPMFAAELFQHEIDRYFVGKVDLNFIFRTTPRSRLYFLDLYHVIDDVVALRKAVSRDLSDDEIYPERGLFSRIHNHRIESLERETPKLKQRFLIDGNWEARDFSRFYGKIADAYSLTAIADEDNEDNDAQDRKFLRDFILDRNFQSGGSYFSFYGVVKESARRDRPLKVAGIEYHSPGYIELVGDASVLSRVVQSIASFRASARDIEPLYKSVYSVLKKEQLLRAAKNTPLPSDAIEAFVTERSTRLADMVGLPKPDHVLRAAGNDVVVFAKVILSYTRRLRDLSSFYDEGRVRSGSNDDDLARKVRGGETVR